jgi:segregation and condensation protein A
MLTRPASAFAPASERPLQHVDRVDLWNTFNIVLRRLAEKLLVGEIHAEQVTVADQMEYVLERIKTERGFMFSSLLTGKVTIRRLVATFLAVLELARLRKLALEQAEDFSDIHCTAVDENALETPHPVTNLPPAHEESATPSS